MTTKREAAAARDGQVDADWKRTLAAIREGLPVARVARKPTNSRQQQILMALCDRQEWKCFWCGEAMTDGDITAPSYRSLEHVIPKSTRRSDVNQISNFRAACQACNTLRGQMAGLKAIIRQSNNNKFLLDKAHETLRSHKITMSGRCLYCKLRFYVLEWWHKRKQGLEIKESTGRGASK
jgi:hypothetical protein